MSVEKFLGLPDAGNLTPYEYAKKLIDERKHSRGTSRTLVQNEILLYFALSPEFPEFTLSTLINDLEETAEVSDRRTRDTELQKAALPRLLEDSQETKVAWDALYGIAQVLLRAGKPLPPELAEWVADVLADQREKKKKREKRRPRPATGPSKEEESRNDFLRIIIIQLKCEFGLNATQNAATRSDDHPLESACGVVAAASGMTYEAVEKIWNNRDHVFARFHEEALESYLNSDP